MNNVLYLYLIIYKDLWTSILIVTLILKKRCIINALLFLIVHKHTPLVVKTIIRLQEKSQIHRFFTNVSFVMYANDSDSLLLNE